MDKNNEKHHKYKKYYKRNQLYWGLGIENEVYLEFHKKGHIHKNFLLTNNQRERYSLDYSKNYKNMDGLRAYVDRLPGVDMQVPFMLNAHSFTNTDKNNTPRLLYTKTNKPNPQFSGQALIEELAHMKNDSWLFDGDTIEFTTLQFFNANLENTVEELQRHKNKFIDELNKNFKKLDVFPKYGAVKIMEQNHPFACFMTNIKNVTMFNNGTLHYNITLPTMLDRECKIQDVDSFTRIHSKAIRMIQWIEPLLIAVYGSPDPLSRGREGYSRASQRCAISRYIGIGTYDSDRMEKGKILTRPVQDKDAWYHEFYKGSEYTKLEEIGLDINFNKHYNHGIELRFLDHMNTIQESFEFIIYCMDQVLSSKKEIENPRNSATWHGLVVNILDNGPEYVLTSDEKSLYNTLFKIKIKSKIVKDVYYELFSKLLLRFNNLFTKKLFPSGPFSKLTLNTKNVSNYSFLETKNSFFGGFFNTVPSCM
jgi:hypothetical protein